jgi:hypothetical protein
MRRAAAARRSSPGRSTSLAGALGLALALSACGGGGGGPVYDDRPPIARPGSPEWTRSSMPLVRAYLTTLSPLVVGQPLDGIRLSDGRRWFEGYVYLGRPKGTPDDLFVVLMRDQAQILAFMWVEPGGEPFPLANCGGSHKPGIRARRLSGQVHTWKTVRPEHGIVYTTCPPEAWIPADLPPPSESSGPTDASEPDPESSD